MRASIDAALAGRPSLSAEVLQAERCDDEGRHAEAIDHLVAGVRRNDLEALTRLGKRLLIGDRAPALPDDGARFLLDARARGGAEASALLAVLHAAGIGGRADFERARAMLLEAALRGWQAAQSQLRVLAGHPADDRSARDWAALARRIDLPYWQSAPAFEDLHAEPLVRLLPSFASGPVCDWLIARARGRLSRALVYDAVAQRTTSHATRTNSSTVFNLLEADLVTVLVQARMAAATRLPFRHLEAATVLHYAAGEEISEHFDFVDPNVPDYARQIAERGERIITFLVYLNDDYAAGETEWPRLGVRHKGRRGQGLFFVNALHDGRPDVRTLHAGRPPADGEKWIVSQFIKNRPAF